LETVIQGWAKVLANARPDRSAAGHVAELRAAVDLAPRIVAEKTPPADLVAAARQSVALVKACAAHPLLDELRCDYLHAERLRRDEEDRLKNAYAEQIEKEQTLVNHVREAKGSGIMARLVEDARQLGFTLHEAPSPASPDERARIRELDGLLLQDDELRKKRRGALDSHARRRLEYEYFGLALKVRPVNALEREIEYLDRRIRAGQVINEQGETLAPPATLATLARQVRLHAVTLAALRFSLARQLVENLRGPDGNLNRYRLRKKFKEPDQTPPVRQDRSDRFWVRAQKEVQRILPGLSQPTVARRLIWFEELLSDFSGEEAGGA
jgi:hypothetical protein